MNGLASLLAGLWLGLLVASSVVAVVNFRTVDRLLGPDLRPELGERLAAVPPAERRAVLRHVVSEVNRWVFRHGSWAQLAVALGFLGCCWSRGGLLRGTALLLLVLTAVQALGLAGAITSLGRSLDFVPRPLPAGVARRFGLLHGAFVLVDLGKLAGLALAAFLLRRPWS